MADRAQVAQAIMSNYTPSWREKIGNSIYDVARALMPGTANRMREEAMMAVDFIPGVGDAVGLNDAYNDFNAGNYGLAAAGLGLTAAGAIPGVGDAVANAGRKGIRAFHGSPHDFDKFSLDKIGTGEGAQAYGHGLYFAESEGVAKAYRDALSDLPFPDGDPANSAYTLLNLRGEEAARSMLSGSRTPEEVEALIARAKDARSGHMYEVRINADPADFLDWDAPLSTQSAPVQEYFRQRMDKVMPGREGWDPDGDTLAKLASPQSDIDGRDWLDTGPQEWATQQMREAGIPGIRYLDQGSRSAGGTRNYVVFDDSLIEVVKKYGLAGAVAAGLISQEMAAQMQAQGIEEL